MFQLIIIIAQHRGGIAMNSKLIFAFVLSLICSIANAKFNKPQDELITVPYVEVTKYLGTWYQISRNVLPFEGDCYCSQQKLSLRDDGNVAVYNSCNYASVNGPIREINGVAYNNDKESNSKFTVDFGLPQKGNYWIIGLDKEYRYAVVSDPSRLSLYILSKTPELSADLYNQAVTEVATQIDVSKLQPTVHMGCQYP